jgi:hypothetical protein
VVVVAEVPVAHLAGVHVAVAVVAEEVKIDF